MRTGLAVVSAMRRAREEIVNEGMVDEVEKNCVIEGVLRDEDE